jgi:hypothetical protein
MDPKWRLLHVLWEHRTKFLVLMLIMSLVAPQPARAQFGIDWGAIVAAINSIGSAITNTIAPALRAINGALGTLSNLVSSIQAFFTNIVYPQAAINRAQGLVGAVQGLYTQIQATVPGECFQRHAGQSTATRTGASVPQPDERAERNGELSDALSDGPDSTGRFTTDAGFGRHE